MAFLVLFNLPLLQKNKNVKVYSRKVLKVVIIAKYIKMVSPIMIKLRVTAKSYEPITFSSLSEAAKNTGLSVSGHRKAYHSGKKTITRKDGKVFNLEWKKQVPYKLPKKVGDTCSVCGSPISFKDKIMPFNMVKLNKFGEIEIYEVFDSIIDASGWSRVSVHALKNACEKGNPKVTRRKGGVQTYWIKWRNKCYKHHHMATNNTSEEVYNRIVEKVGEE